MILENADTNSDGVLDVSEIRVEISHIAELQRYRSMIKSINILINIVACGSIHFMNTLNNTDWADVQAECLDLLAYLDSHGEDTIDKAGLVKFWITEES